MALVSNVFLLLNMAKRVRFSIAQPITLVGWYISAILLVCLTSTAAGPLLEGIKFPQSELIWSQAFYYGMWAAMLYFVDASLMVVTFYGASSGHYSKDFNLTSSQRTLMLQTIMFLMYLLLGALVFSTIEGWNYLDAVYWADVTLFTVGFGDFAPSTTLAKALMLPYALIGVISLGLVIGSIRSLILDRGKRRVDARLEERKRRRIVCKMTRRGSDGILQPIRTNIDKPQGARSDDLPTTEFERRRAEFDIMRKIQVKASSRRRWVAMAISASSWLVIWLVGAVIFVACEKRYQGWEYFDSFFFCFTALTTIGYGDYTPVSNAGKSFFVFWSLLALPTMTVLISNASDTVVKFIRDGTLHLGNVTILPGESSFKTDFHYIINKCTLGKLFPKHDDQPMPSAKDSKSTSSTGQEATAALQKENINYDEERGRTRQDTNHTSSSYTSQVQRSLSRMRDPCTDLPTGSDYRFLLISEIQILTKHIRETKPRQYSYREWAWYLKLIGEDENNANMHRKATSKCRHKRQRKSQGDNHGKKEDGSCDEDEDTRWSWVGKRSPLTGSQEETEWILDRLMDRLKESLSLESRRDTKDTETIHWETR